MCSMNQINGTYSCESQDVIGRFLKVEMGFPGFVISDAGAPTDAIGSAVAGMDLGSFIGLSVAIENGTFPEARLDDMVVRQLMGYYRYGQDVGE
jgi:beta-glucosidase